MFKVSLHSGSVLLALIIMCSHSYNALIMLSLTIGLVYWIPKFIVKSINYILPEVIFNSYLYTKKKSPSTYQSSSSFQLISQYVDVSKKIALTIDDAPRESMERILDILDKFNIKVTFFVVKNQVTPLNEHLLLRALRSGHQLCNHGSTDSVHALKIKEVFDSEISLCDNFLKILHHSNSIKMPQTKFYRPGCGMISPTILEYCRENDYKIVLGNVYPHDSLFRSSTINYYYITSRIQQGDIVIIHDRSWTPDLLEKLLKWIIKNDFECVTLDQFI